MANLWILYGWLVLTAAQIDGVATRDGSSVQELDRQQLPNARHTSDVVDAMLIAPVGAQVGGGGIDMFDSVRLSVHGRSVTQLRFFWGVTEFSDPARPGEPLVDMPISAWKRLTLHTLWSDRPGLSFVTPTGDGPNHPKHAAVVVSGSIARGPWGDAIVWPNSWFDRNDARLFGAPTSRRALSRGEEGELQLVVPLKRGSLFILGERLEHRHRYLTTSQPEWATRDSALLAFSQTIGSWSTDVRALMQMRQRTQDGAAYRFDDSRVLHQAAQAWLFQAESLGPVGKNARLRLSFGSGGRTDTERGAGAPGVAEDLQDTWLYLARPRGAQMLRRWQLTTEARLSFLADDHALWDDADRLALGMDPALHLTASASVARWQRLPQADPIRVGTRFGGTAITMNSREGAQDGAIERHSLRAGMESHWPLGGPGRGLDVSGGVDFTALSDERRLLVQSAGPSAGALVTWRSKRGLNSFFMVRREPEAITAQVGDFLGAIGPRGSVYTWQDTNGDGIPGADEAGARLGGFGATSHGVGAALKRPGHTQVAVGVQSPPFARMRAGVRAVAHALSGRYTVVADGDGAADPTTFHDPGGDGRGEVRAAEGGQNLTVWRERRVPERYVLTNSKKLTYYLGLEAELTSEPHPWASLSVVGAAYFAKTHAPFGNFADRNDPGIIDEASATRNNALNSYGRMDSDRSFALKILAALRPIQGLSLGLAARYRDGQPFTRIVVDDSLPQGPTALMATPRGKARHTALMLWDLRLRYQNDVLRPLGLTLTFDVYNVLNSATEVAEDPRTGPTFRRALEAIPGRSAWLGLALAFLP